MSFKNNYSFIFFSNSYVFYFFFCLIVPARTPNTTLKRNWLSYFIFCSQGKTFKNSLLSIIFTNDVLQILFIRLLFLIWKEMINVEWLECFFFIYWHDHIYFFFFLLIWSVILINFEILNYCIPEISSTWSWCSILFMFLNGNICLAFSHWYSWEILGCCYPFLSFIEVILASWNYLESVSPFSVF